MIAQHSSETNEHYTPAWLVDMSREVLGEIDLDPASCPAAQDVVQARAGHYEPPTGQLGGLAVEWEGRVLLNPPGGKLNPQTLLPLPRNTQGKQGGPGLSSAAVWWGKLWQEWSAGRVHSAIFICFSLAVFRTTQDPELGIPEIYRFPFVVPRERVNYDRAVWLPEGSGGRWGREPTKGAPADSAITYLPPSFREYTEDMDLAADRLAEQEAGISRFEKVFAKIGKVRL